LRRGQHRPRLSDLWIEAMHSLAARPGRSLLTALGTVLGIATVVAMAGIAQMAALAIDDEFDALAATSVRVMPADSSALSGVGGLPWDAAEQTLVIVGVVSAATVTEVNVDRRHDLPDAITVVSASSGVFRTEDATLLAGRFFDDGHSARAESVVVVGASAADTLGVGDLDAQPAVFVADEAFVVIGVATGFRDRTYESAVFLPNGTARELEYVEAVQELRIRTTRASAHLVGEQVPYAVSPRFPESLSVIVAPEASVLRSKIASSVSSLLRVLVVVSLAIGALGIASTTLTSVLERTGEIGLRSAVGSTTRQVGVLFLIESGSHGLLGGLLGSGIGVLINIAVAIGRGWTPAFQPALLLITPLAGAIIGIVAGVYPAYRAARLDPAEALRSVAG